MRGILLYDLDLPDSEDWAGQIQDALKNTKDISSFEELRQVIKDKKRTGLSAFRIPRILSEEETEDKESIVVSWKGNIQKILCHKITYVESNKRTVKIVTKEKEYVIYMKMDYLEMKLPDYFLRTHQSYLINMKFVRKFSAEGVMLSGEKLEIPISRSRYKETKKKFEEYYKIEGVPKVIK